MTIQELRAELKAIEARESCDPEKDHNDADNLLLKYINDDEVDRLFNSIEMWYA